MPRLFPLRPRPIQDELFSSWVTRVAAAHGLDTKHFLLNLAPLARRAGGEHPSWVLLRKNLESDHLIGLMAAGSGYPVEEVRRLTVRSRYKGVPPQLLIRSLCPSVSVPKVRSGLSFGAQVEAFCPECLKESLHIRRAWHLSFYCLCPIHRRELIELCPRCESGLDFEGRLLAQFGPHADAGFPCHTCGLDLIQTKKEITVPQIGSGYLDFQRFLVAMGASQVPALSSAAARDYFGDLRGLFRNIIGSDFRTLGPWLGVSSESVIWNAFKKPGVTSSPSTQTCAVRYLLLCLAHLCLERNVTLYSSGPRLRPQDQRDHLAASLPGRLGFLVNIEFPVFLAGASTHEEPGTTVTDS